MTYLVGYSPHKEDTCALELACLLARTEGDSVHAVTVVPRAWETSAGHEDGDFASWARAEGEASAKEALAMLAEHPEVESRATWVTARSVPAAIMEQAESLDATAIVVGSGLEGLAGRITLTAKTDRLLHSSKVPVAIAPRGFLPRPDARVTRLTFAYRDDDSHHLLDDLAARALGIGATIRLITIALKRPAMVTSGIRDAEAVVFERLIEQAHASQVEAAEKLSTAGIPTEAVDGAVVTGRSWAEAMGEVVWEEGDVLVVGSSGTHPLAEVFLGSSAAKIIRNAPVPVLVVP